MYPATIPDPYAVRCYEACAEAFIRQLPSALRDVAASVRLVVMERPNGQLVDEGCEPGEAGAYIVRGEEPMCLDDGLADDGQEKVIYLFAANIRSEEHCREVVMHELAHACGFTEAEVIGLFGRRR